MSYAAFRDRLSTLYALYPVVKGVFHPADSVLTDFLLTEKSAARWLVKFIRTQPRYRKGALATVERLDSELTRWWGPCVLAWSKKQERAIRRTSPALLALN